MNPYFTKDPIVGTPLTPSVIRQINTAVRRYMPIAGNGIRTTITAGGTIISAIPAPASKKADVEFLHPFEVKWSASANNKQGAWVIWLPDTTKLVHVGNTYISPIANIVAEAALPTGWYRMSTVTATSTAVWLNITTVTQTGQIWLDISSSAGQSTTGFICVPLLIATMTRDAQTGSWSVKQFIDSAITFGGSSGGGGGGLTGTVEFVADVDWYVNGSVHQLRKRLRVLDLATGNVTDKADTTYANGWEVAANTTPITSIIN